MAQRTEEKGIVDQIADKAFNGGYKSKEDLKLDLMDLQMSLPEPERRQPQTSGYYWFIEKNGDFELLKVLKVGNKMVARNQHGTEIDLPQLVGRWIEIPKP